MTDDSDLRHYVFFRHCVGAVAAIIFVSCAASAFADNTTLASVPLNDVPTLVRELQSPDTASHAARLLGDTGDSRAIAPLLQSTVYGMTATIRKTAMDALVALAAEPSLRNQIAAQLSANPDPELRLAATAVLEKNSTTTDTATPALATAVPLPRRGQERETETARKNVVSKSSDRDRTRLVYSNTALIRETGQWNWTVHNIALWDIGYGVNDHVELSVQTVPPIGLVAALPRIKAGFSIREDVHVAFNVTGGFLIPYAVDSDLFGVLGAGPILTLGDEGLLFNMSAPLYRFFGASEPINIFAPNIGLGARISNYMRFNAEVHVPFIIGEDFGTEGKVWILLYGLRFSGKRLYGDVSFVLPITRYISEYIAYIPIGAPLVSFGLTW